MYCDCSCVRYFDTNIFVNHGICCNIKVLVSLKYKHSTVFHRIIRYNHSTFIDQMIGFTRLNYATNVRYISVHCQLLETRQRSPPRLVHNHVLPTTSNGLTLQFTQTKRYSLRKRIDDKIFLTNPPPAHFTSRNYGM